MPTKKIAIPEFNYLLPPEECTRIYEVLGGEPELDPCGHPDQFLQAGRTLYGMGEDDDGALVDWSEFKTVVMNATHGERPPRWDEIEASNPGWERPDWMWHPFSQWIKHAVESAAKGVTVFAFLPAATDREWFHAHIETANAVVFLKQRVKGYKPSSDYGAAPMRGPQPMNAHMHALWSKDTETVERFCTIYGERGVIIEPTMVAV